MVTPEIQEVITGMILSDGTIVFSKGYGKGNAQLKVEQKDRDFVYHLFEKLKDSGIAAGEPKARSRFDKGTGKTDVMW